jgi:two-component system, OmpR family, response regulator MtrA
MCQSNPKNKKILIIDDDHQDLKGMAVVLGKEGFPEVFLAENAGKGLEAIKSFCPDIIILDVVLPQVNGLDIAREIKSLAGDRAKIIMITGHLDAVNAQKARTSGADEIIEKNQGFTHLVPTIRRLS